MSEKSVIIVGAGPGGYVAAIRAAQLGGKVTLIEKGELGGTCLNWGCIPTKALLRGVELLESVKAAQEFGIQTTGVSVDFGKLMARKDRAVKTLVSGVGGLMKANGVEVVKGKGRLIAPGKVQVADEKGQTSVREAGKIILATGSVSARLPIPGGDLPGVMDSSGVLGLTRVPESMVIVGAGPIGLEFGTVFAALGTRVTVIEMLPQVLPTEDAEVAAALDKSLRGFKIEILTGSQVKEIVEAGGKKKVVAQTAQGEKALEAEVVLVAVGRKPNLEDLGLKEAGVRVGKKGIEVNDKMETSVAGVYAIGDVTGQWLLAHFASAQGEVAAENALGREASLVARAVPRCVYTLPEVAAVGLTEKEAREKGEEVQVGRFPFAANGKAAVIGERSGFMKVITEAKYGEVLGVHIIGPHATDLIGESVLAMQLEGTARDIARAIHPHPTLTEALREAALDVEGIALHFPPRKKG